MKFTLPVLNKHIDLLSYDDVAGNNQFFSVFEALLLTNLYFYSRNERDAGAGARDVEDNPGRILRR